MITHIRWGELVAEHAPRGVGEDWSTVHAHHERLWPEGLSVQRGAFSVYEEAAQWS
ncbi:MAG: hypothetical protein GWN95_04885 [Gammaproteobacteria bacterium]|nr:hypothetical protein [Gammaproteobacteria bacterium]